MAPPPPSLDPRFGFPRKDGQSVSYWLQGMQGDPLLDHHTTPDIPRFADIVVIGSGMTGTLVAKHCLDTWPGKSVLILEAREFCSGATGRNAGHCKPDQFRGFKRYEELFGTQQALQILENEQQTWTSLVQYVRLHDVNCDLWVGHTLNVPVTPEVADSTKDLYDCYRSAGGRVDHIEVTLDPTEAAKISRIKDAQACYAWPAATLYPWKLTAHIMRDNLERGANLQTHTTVMRVEKSAQSLGKWIIKSDRGDIECAQVVHATNAYSSGLEPSLRGLIRPSPHICNKVVPPAAFGGSLRLKNSYGVYLPDGAMFSINPRCNSDDDIVLFGGSNPGQVRFENWLAEQPDRCVDDSITSFNYVSDAIKDLTERQFPEWADSTPNQYNDGWSGIIALSADTVPFIGQLPGLPGQWICAGHHGHGMARIFTAAPALVMLMDGKPWIETRLPEVFEVTTERMERLLKQESALSAVPLST